MTKAQKVRLTNLSHYILAMVVAFSAFTLSGNVLSSPSQKRLAQTEVSATIARSSVRQVSYHHKQTTQGKSHSCHTSLHPQQIVNGNVLLSQKHDATIKREWDILNKNILCYSKPERQNVKYAPRSSEDIYFTRG